ncbi:hypothetical protein Tco_0809832 [Tanacetum coccineum]
MSVAVARGHGGGDDPSRPPPRPIGTGVGGRKATRGGRGGGRDGGSKGTRKETRNLGLKKVRDEYGPLKIQFEFNDKGTMLHLGENSARWSNLVGELVREYPMYYPSWHKIKEDKKAGVLGWLMQHFDLTPHICSLSFGQKSRRASISIWPRHNRICRLTISLTLSTLPESLKMLKTEQRARSSAGRDPAHWLSSEISRWRAPRPDEARVQYEEMLRLRDLGANTPTVVPYTEEQIMAMIETKIDEIKEDGKRLRKELELLRRVVRSDDRMSQMLTQLESHHEIGGGSESGSGGVGIMSRSGMRMSAGMRTLTGMRRFNTFYIWAAAEQLSFGSRRHVVGENGTCRRGYYAHS